MLHVTHLTVHFDHFTALNDISFRVAPGEIFGLLGPNGAGKTTTLKVLTGQVRPDAGLVLLQNRNLWEDFEYLKPLMGYVADFDCHIEELSARRNLALFCSLYRLPAQRVDEVLGAVELSHEQGQKVRTYSKGMKKKLSIAREILHGPRLLLLDEPTANLDVHSTHLIRDLLRRFAAEGTTVLCTTHDMEEAEEICDRLAILDQGRILELDSPAGLKAKYGEPLLEVELAGQQAGTFRLDRSEDRALLAEKLQAGEVLSIQSRSCSLKDVFLRLTGRPFL